MSTEVHQKWGFGMAPPKPETTAARRAAATLTLDVLSRRSTLAPDPAALAAISVVKGLFARVFREDQWDWFTVAGQLGHPRRGTAMAMADGLARLRSSVRDGDETGFLTTRLVLDRLPTTTCLRTYMGELRLAEVPDSGWLYVLSTREIPDLLKVGMTTRTVEERAAEINRATGVAIPFGVRRCWHVTSPALAERRAHEVLSDRRTRGDREFFRVDFVEAVRRIQDAVDAGGLELETMRALNST